MKVIYKTGDFLPEYMPTETSYNLIKVEGYCCEEFMKGVSIELFAFGGYPEYPNTVAGKYFIFHTKH